MVLKCGNGKEWSYLDDIQFLTIKNYDNKEETEAPIVFHIPAYDGGEVSITKGMFIKRNKEDRVKSYHITAPHIYLLSDEGKTIERIN